MQECRKSNTISLIFAGESIGNISENQSIALTNFDI